MHLKGMVLDPDHDKEIIKIERLLNLLQIVKGEINGDSQLDLG